jgi:hypothetical protein
MIFLIDAIASLDVPPRDNEKDDRDDDHDEIHDGTLLAMTSS